jgi:hypothetical protein
MGFRGIGSIDKTRFPSPFFKERGERVANVIRLCCKKPEKDV